MDINIISIVIGIVGIAISIFIARKNIKNFFNKIRTKENVSIFGPTEAGKSTLIRYLQGKPLTEAYEHTFGAEPVGKIVFDLTGNETYYFRSKEMFDVGGEFKNQWKAIIETQNPNGIIYIIDTQNKEEEIKGLNCIYNIYNNLRAERLATEINLKVILILLNKYDLWGSSHQIREQQLSEYRNLFKDISDTFNRDFGNDLIILYGVSALTKNEYMNMNNDILRQFAGELAKKMR